MQDRRVDNHAENKNEDTEIEGDGNDFAKE
jgi:hypothetical protein